ncbi:MAG: single-stranded DNA-binding protein, partial [Gemmatimonadota bacterium]
MARSLNKTMIIGNLGADPEVRTTPGGTRVATLSVATSRSWTGKTGDQQERTEWHRVVAWDRLAEICERYLKKGDRVYVE